jgi:hypothetical protein
MAKITPLFEKVADNLLHKSPGTQFDQCEREQQEAFSSVINGVFAGVSRLVAVRDAVQLNVTRSVFSDARLAALNERRSIAHIHASNRATGVEMAHLHIQTSGFPTVNLSQYTVNGIPYAVTIDYANPLDSLLQPLLLALALTPARSEMFADLRNASRVDFLPCPEFAHHLLNVTDQLKLLEFDRYLQEQQS